MKRYDTLAHLVGGARPLPVHPLAASVYAGVVTKRSPEATPALLTTVTGEAFQPVRLYYTVPNKSVATKVLARLRCIDEDKAARCWVWLYVDEAESLTFGRPRSEVPADAHPIVIGRFRFPDKTRMTLELRSADRAVEAAKFFAPLFGQSVALSRLRVVNRWFAAEEAAVGLDRLDKLLDSNVVRIDPGDAERAFERAMAGAHTEAEKRAALAAHLEESRRKDVPLVEDLPLHADEETPNFRDLTMLLRLRSLRALEHWRGSTGTTLGDIIQRTVERMEPGGS